MADEYLEELAVRCEKTVGQDRHLGAAIEIALDSFPERAYRQKNAMRPRGSREIDRVEFAAEWFGAGPTGSIDNALLLVPKGMWAEGSLSSPAAIEIHAPMTYDPIGKGCAATPALAICAAALRARANIAAQEMG